MQYEAIDKLRCQCVAKAEKGCRKLCTGQVAFSPELKLARQKITAWRLLVKRCKGGRVSSRFLRRSMDKSNITRSWLAETLEKNTEQLTQAFKAYYDIKRKCIDLRQTQLDSLAEALAVEGNSSKEKMGSTSRVSIPISPNTWRDITDKKGIEAAIMDSNRRKFSQSAHTPFYHQNMVREFGYQGWTPASQAVLHGYYVPPQDADPHVLLLLNALQKPASMKTLGNVETKIPIQEHCKFWRKAKENTSCYPDSLSFAAMKASSFNDYNCEVDCLMARVPLVSGYTPAHWKKCLDVMILKKAGVTHLDSLHTIVMFPVDCNYAFKFIDKGMMALGEQGSALAPEHYGSQKHRRAIDLAVNKSLTDDILRQLKRPGAICSNDAKSCCKLIGHTPASLAMQRCGVPKSAIKCLFTQLQTATHQVRMSYGDSSTSYGDKTWIPVLHGIGQGNGAGPAIWAVLSTPLLHISRSKGLHCQFIAPFSAKSTCFSGFALCR